MANNCDFYPNAYLNAQQWQPGMVAYMLGVGPMPPPQPEEIAFALANHVLDPDANRDLNQQFGEYAVLNILRN